MSKKKQETTEPEQVESIQSRLLGIEGLMEYLSLGRNNARQLGKDSRAVIRVGRRVLYDRKKIDEYLEGMAGDY